MHFVITLRTLLEVSASDRPFSGCVVSPISRSATYLHCEDRWAFFEECKMKRFLLKLKHHPPLLFSIHPTHTGGKEIKKAKYDSSTSQTKSKTLK